MPQEEMCSQELTAIHNPVGICASHPRRIALHLPGINTNLPLQELIAFLHNLRNQQQAFRRDQVVVRTMWPKKACVLAHCSCDSQLKSMQIPQLSHPSKEEKHPEECKTTAKTSIFGAGLIILFYISRWGKSALGSAISFCSLIIP